MSKATFILDVLPDKELDVLSNVFNDLENYKKKFGEIMKDDNQRDKYNKGYPGIISERIIAIWDDTRLLFGQVLEVSEYILDYAHINMKFLDSKAYTLNEYVMETVLHMLYVKYYNIHDFFELLQENLERLLKLEQHLLRKDIVIIENYYRFVNSAERHFDLMLRNNLYDYKNSINHD